jgi:hypothetical protein
MVDYKSDPALAARSWNFLETLSKVRPARRPVGPARAHFSPCCCCPTRACVEAAAAAAAAEAVTGRGGQDGFRELFQRGYDHVAAPAGTPDAAARPTPLKAAARA